MNRAAWSPIARARAPHGASPESGSSCRPLESRSSAFFQPSLSSPSRQTRDIQPIYAITLLFKNSDNSYLDDCCNLAGYAFRMRVFFLQTSRIAAFFVSYSLSQASFVSRTVMVVLPIFPAFAL